jgi:hypothetical protein
VLQIHEVAPAFVAGRELSGQGMHDVALSARNLNSFVLHAIQALPRASYPALHEQKADPAGELEYAPHVIQDVAASKEYSSASQFKQLPFPLDALN